MKVETFDGIRERQGVTALVTSTPVLGQVASQWASSRFASPWANLVGGWCVDYYRRYGEAPGRNIEGLFRTWAESAPDSETVAIVEGFLAGLSDEYEAAATVNPSAQVDELARLFRRVSLGRLKDDIEAHLDAGQLEKAEEVAQGFNRVQLGSSSGTNFFHDPEALKAVFAQDASESLITYGQDAIDSLFRHRLCRGQFVAFMGPEKSGKTRILLDLAVRALEQRRRVAFIEIGDETKEDLHHRLLVRALGRPIVSETGEWPYTVTIPKSISIDKQTKALEVEVKQRIYQAPLDEARALKLIKKFNLNKVRSRRVYYKDVVFPNLAVGVDDIRSLLTQWALEDFTPDVVIIDYADNLAPPPGRLESRDQINRNWQLLRALSQETHTLLITATQARRDSYDRKLITRSHITDDKRKLAHATAVFGLNVLDDEKEQEVTRLNVVVGRKGKYVSRRMVYLAGCWALGNPAVLSSY